MITIKTKEEIEIMKEGGRRHSYILSEVAKKVVPGVSTQILEDEARKLIKEGGDTASFLNYTPRGARRAYPAALCVSVNNEIVHGIPNEKPRILLEGDIVTLDLGLTHGGLITDSAVTVGVGRIAELDLASGDISEFDGAEALALLWDNHMAVAGSGISR